MIRIRTLGESTITVGTREISPKARALFQLLLYLGIERGRRIPRASLAALIWGHSNPEKSNHSLRQTLYELRRAGARLAGDATYVVLDPNLVDIDIAKLDNDGLDAVAAATVGDFLPGISGRDGTYYEWLDDVRERVNARRRRILLNELFRSRRAGHLEQVEQIARELRRIDPLNEEANCALAECLAAHGSKAEALATLQSYVREIGEDNRTIGLPAKLLADRISADNVSEPDTALMYGRDDILATLRAEIERTISEATSTSTWIWGEAGIGKTHVLERVAREASIRGMAVIATSCPDRQGKRPFATAAEIVQQLLRAPGALGCDPDALALLKRLTSEPGLLGNYPGTERDAREAIASALADLVAAVAGEQALLVAIDDVQWIDPASLSALQHLISTVRSSPCSIMFASRIAPGVGFGAGIYQMTVALQTLNSVASEALAGALLKCQNVDSSASEWIARVSGGHPLHLVELTREVARGNLRRVPESLRELLTSKLASLSSNAENVLLSVVLLANHASPARLEKLLGLSPLNMWNALKELATAGLVVDDGSLVRVRHDLLAEAVLDQTDPSVLRYAHYRIAQIFSEELQRGHASLEITWDSAQHWRSAGEAQQAQPLVHDCIQHLLEVGLFEDAVRLLEKFLSEGVGPSYRASLFNELGLIHASRSEWKNALSAFHQAQLECAASQHLAPDVALVLIEARWKQMISTSAQTVEDLRDFIAQKAAVYLRLAAANQLLIIADYQLSDNLEAEAYKVVQSLRRDTFDPRSRHQILRAETLHASIIGNIDHALKHVSQLVADARALRSPLALSRALMWNSHICRRAGQIDAARAQLHEAIRITDGRYAPEVCAHSRIILAVLELSHGSLDASCAAMETAGRDLGDRSNSGVVAHDYLVTRAKLDLELGRPQLVGQSIAQLDLDAFRERAPSAYIQALAVSVRARVALAETVSPAEVAELLEFHMANRHRAFQDYVMTAVFETLSFVQRSEEAHRLLLDYLNGARTDRYPPSRPLARIIAQCARTSA